MNTRLRLRADFNGVFREEGGGFLVCLSHAETCRDERGSDITVNEGTTATAFDEDVDERGNRDDLLASGTIERALDSSSRRERHPTPIGHSGVPAAQAAGSGGSRLMSITAITEDTSLPLMVA